MKNLNIYCMALNSSNLETIKKLSYIPVGLKNKDFSSESSFLNTLNVWCNDQVTAKNLSKFDASIIGAKKMNGSPVYLEDILDSTVPDLSKDIYGLYVPSDQVLKRTKYSWFAQLSAEDVLTSNTTFTKLLMASY